MDWILKEIKEKKQLLTALEEGEYISAVEKACELMVKSIKNGGKVITAGNGGSAADAQHFAGEIVGRFLKNRDAMPAMSLCVDPSVVTCISNDFGYDEVFARQLAGVGNAGDVFVGISTSGNSENIIRAIDAAHKKGITVVGFLGKDGGKIKDMCDVALVVPSDSTPRIQEIHTFTVHLICEEIEKKVFG